MPPPLLAGVYSKIEWAKDHLRNFRVFQEQFLREYRDLIPYEEDADAKQRIYRLARNDLVPIALQTGDILHGLRGALDHFAFAACTAGPGGISRLSSKERHAVQFPICGGTANEYETMVTGGVVVRFAKAGIAKALIEAEAYKTGKNHVLWQLSWLNNADKHRMLTAVGLQVPSVSIGSFVGETLEKMFKDLGGDPAEFKMPDVFLNPADKSVLKAGDEVFREPLDREPYKYVNLSFPIALNEPEVGGTEPLVELIGRMTDAVSNVIRDLEPFAIP